MTEWSQRHGGRLPQRLPRWTALRGSRRYRQRTTSAGRRGRDTIQATKSSRSTGPAAARRAPPGRRRATIEATASSGPAIRNSRAPTTALTRSSGRNRRREHEPQRQQHQPEEGTDDDRNHGDSHEDSEERHADDGQHGQFDHQRSSGPRQGRALMRCYARVLREVPGTELIVAAARASVQEDR